MVTTAFSPWREAVKRSVNGGSVATVTMKSDGRRKRKVNDALLKLKQVTVTKANKQPATVWCWLAGKASDVG